MGFLLFVAVIALIILYLQLNSSKKKAQEEADANSKLKYQIELQKKEIESLSAFRGVRDATEAAQKIRAEAEARLKEAEATASSVLAIARAEASAIVEKANIEASEIRKDANLDAKTKKEKVDALLDGASKQASQIIMDANKKAAVIAGDAYEALKNADKLKEVATAMQNVIEGYGDKYLKPTFSLLDDLAEAYGFDEAGQQLKIARDRTKLMVENGQAAQCEYAEKNRKDTAIKFVTDAFNGKVDSILSRTKADNFGTLEQQIRDAFTLVNMNGAAFRNAVVTEAYLDARLAELKWATAVFAIREREREEQRRIREQIREEEKARREIERALKEAAKEEETLQKAMEKVQAQVAKANEEQRAAFMAQLADLEEKLKQAEERNQRALSMAQQTKAGHVYVISNEGSFGEHVYKVGMTRRLEPMERIKELGDASVPFGFDVHALIWSDDAPGLENALHKHFVKRQINKVNPRKEFFRLSIEELRAEAEKLGVKASWTMAAVAAEYRESKVIEQQLAVNAPMAQEWLRDQLKFDAKDEVLAELVEEQ